MVGCADPVTNAKKEVISAKIGMDSFVHLERANGAIIKQVSPGAYKPIHNYSNMVRRNGQQWLNTAIALIDAYSASKSDASKSQMDNAIAVLTAAAAQSANYVTEINAAIGATAAPPATPALTPNPSP